MLQPCISNPNKWCSNLYIRFQILYSKTSKKFLYTFNNVILLILLLLIKLEINLPSRKPCLSNMKVLKANFSNKIGMKNKSIKLYIVSIKITVSKRDYGSKLQRLMTGQLWAAGCTLSRYWKTAED